MNKELTFNDLLVDHSYYCNLSNYFSNDALLICETFEDFYDDWIDADIDYNMIFRWDIKEAYTEDEKPNGLYCMEIFIMQQRKGIFMPVKIKSVTENDTPKIIELLTKHHNYLMEIWQPFKQS